MSFTQTITERAKVSDFLIAEWDHRYNRQKVTVENNSGATIDFQPGEILDEVSGDYEPTSVANNGNAILLEDIGELADGEAKSATVLIRGPAVVNTDALRVQAAATKATVLTNLASALSPEIVFITEPTKQQTGPLLP